MSCHQIIIGIYVGNWCVKVRWTAFLRVLILPDSPLLAHHQVVLEIGLSYPHSLEVISALRLMGVVNELDNSGWGSGMDKLPGRFIV